MNKKRNNLFSLKKYLLKKTQARADKLQFRAKKKEDASTHKAHSHDLDNDIVVEENVSESE